MVIVLISALYYKFHTILILQVRKLVVQVTKIGPWTKHFMLCVRETSSDLSLSLFSLTLLRVESKKFLRKTDGVVSFDLGSGSKDYNIRFLIDAKKRGAKFHFNPEKIFSMQYTS